MFAMSDNLLIPVLIVTYHIGIAVNDCQYCVHDEHCSGLNSDLKYHVSKLPFTPY